MKYSFIAQNKKTWTIEIMCLLMGVLRSGYYNYLRKINNKTDDPYHQELLDFIKQIAEKSCYTYGSWRMRRALNALGYPVGRNKTKKLMKEAGIIVRYRKKYKVTTNSNTAERIALLKRFIEQFGKERVACLLADREFVGNEWFSWLRSEGISFCIRIKSNTQTTAVPDKLKPASPE